MGLFILCLFACMIVAGGAGPFDNWLAFFAWSILAFIPIGVGILLCIAACRKKDKDDDDDGKI